MTVHVPVAFRHRRGRKTLVSPAQDFASSFPTSRPSAYSPAVKALARAFRWRKLIEDGTVGTLQEIATTENINPSYVSRVLRLTLLAPECIEIIVRFSSQTYDVGAATKPFPIDWCSQHHLLGRLDDNSSIPSR